MSRFVSAGGETKDAAQEAAREDAWAKAQAQIEALRAKPSQQEGKQEGGKSLYEVLEANKGLWSRFSVVCLLSRLLTRQRACRSQQTGGVRGVEPIKEPISFT